MAEIIVPTIGRKRARRIVGTIEQRFWPKVDKSPGHGPWGDCWIWTATLFRGGYGKFSVATSACDHAHRVSWRLANGPITDGLNVLHRCDNRPCIRPDHLFLGTLADNNEDMANKGRKYRKLTEEEVRQIKLGLSLGISQQLTADRLGVNQTLISAIKRGIVWNHVTI